MADIKKIIIEDSEGKRETYTEGLVVYTTNNDKDLEARFANIDSKKKIIAITSAIMAALKEAIANFDAAEKAQQKSSKQKKQ